MGGSKLRVQHTSSPGFFCRITSVSAKSWPPAPPAPLPPQYYAPPLSSYSPPFSSVVPNGVRLTPDSMTSAVHAAVQVRWAGDWSMRVQRTCHLSWCRSALPCPAWRYEGAQDAVYRIMAGHWRRGS